MNSVPPIFKIKKFIGLGCSTLWKVNFMYLLCNCFWRPLCRTKAVVAKEKEKEHDMRRKMRERYANAGIKKNVLLFFAIVEMTSLVLQAPNKILYESYKVLHASYKEVWLFLGRNIVFQLATERTIFFSKQSQVCLEVIY